MSIELLAGLDQSQLTDQTQVQAGGSARGLLPTGRAVVRPFLYIEVGQHIDTYQGKPKPVAPYFRFGVKIVGGAGKNLEGKVEKFVGDDGYFPELQSFFHTQLAFTEKAKTPKWLAALNKVGATQTHMAWKVAESGLYYLDIGVTTKDDGKQYNTYDFALLQPAIKIDEDTLEETVVKAPPIPKEDMKIFIWDLATKAQWDSIYIDGEWEKKDASGKVIGKESKNRYQDEIRKAVNFEGSLAQSVSGETALFVAPDLDAEKMTSEVPAVPTVPSTPDVPVVPEVPETPDALPF